MEDKRKLTAAIIGAITAYIQMEQPPPPAFPRVKPEPKPISRKFPEGGSK
ncbi:MAG: hypothetical protein KAV68_03000 [Dehalococcoidales bacterium]|nr:hypothetical protein [Dehalococcoidales bacterium]